MGTVFFFFFFNPLWCLAEVERLLSKSYMFFLGSPFLVLWLERHLALLRLAFFFKKKLSAIVGISGLLASSVPNLDI